MSLKSSERLVDHLVFKPYLSRQGDEFQPPSTDFFVDTFEKAFSNGVANTNVVQAALSAPDEGKSEEPIVILSDFRRLREPWPPGSVALVFLSCDPTAAPNIYFDLESNETRAPVKKQSEHAAVSAHAIIIPNSETIPPTADFLLERVGGLPQSRIKTTLRKWQTEVGPKARCARYVRDAEELMAVNFNLDGALNLDIFSRGNSIKDLRLVTQVATSAALDESAVFKEASYTTLLKPTRDLSDKNMLVRGLLQVQDKVAGVDMTQLHVRYIDQNKKQKTRRIRDNDLRALRAKDSELTRLWMTKTSLMSNFEKPLTSCSYEIIDEVIDKLYEILQDQRPDHSGQSDNDPSAA
jgi:hypothetical protein